METYHGHVRTPGDAIILFEACRIGLLPRVQRRLSEKERQSIKSGSVFVWDEREAGMRRWTDGKSWSASRVSGSFLTYREMEGKRGGNGFDKTANRDGVQGQEGDSDGGGPDGYRYKPDGLMKQSFSITTNNGQHLHLISYFSRSSSAASTLMQPTNDPTLRHIRPEKGMYPESTVHEQSNIPPVTRGPMGSPGYTHSPQHPAPYARQYGPYHQPWAPPSPMHTPPPHTYPPYYAHPSQHPQQHPPHPQQQPPHPQSHPQHQQHPQYHGQPPMNAHHYPPPPPNYAQAPPPPPTTYDRAPPPLAGAALPHPPHQYASAPPQSYPPPYSHSYPAPYPGYPPPPLQHHPSYPPPPPLQHHNPPYDHRMPAPIADSAHPHRDDRQDSMHALKPETERTPPTAVLASPPAPINEQSSKLASVPPTVQPLPAAQPQPPSSGQTIPSISSMLNGGAAAQPPSPGSRASTSRGPLQDIPSHKLGFEASRDVQALRNLDKTTFKGY